ncbi:MAG: autotransporter domain-containing protein [Fusobacterium varium]|uniref:autotransporter domain-containing protein n=1 Tax=Fusobacterium varium TaxID=856 RepID=UPI00242F7C32|nr:autotransporter outer membrane beta-barrel domain-containing protein [Fusobacterium varium]UYI80154.1 MAG: autotransporter domain-containing protein [Fusobacterium varium]
MISNFSEVEKSLKRCLKEKVSITAATVVRFLIAGTVAFGVATDVTVKGDADGTIKITGVDSKTTEIGEKTSGKLTVGDISTETEKEGSLAGLLTVEVNGTAAIIKGNYDNQKEIYLGTLKISSSANQEVTFLTTDEDYTSITSDLKVEVTGQEGKSATAMEAAEEGHTVTNAGEITVNKYAVGMVAGAGATAVNDKNSGESAGITVNADTGEANTAIGMVADGDKATATNNGKIDAQKGIGMLAKNGATIENSTDATIEAGNNEDTSAGTGMLVTGNGTATNNGTINVNYTGSIGMSTTTVADSTTTLTNNGTIDVKAGTGISVAGAGEAIVTGGTISVDNVDGNIGINIAGTGTTTVTGAAITLAGEGTGINAEGNVTLKDIAITLSDGATGTGIVYAGGDTEAKAEISTRDIDIKAAGKGIEATMSKAAKSTLNITTGIISTGNASATGIAIIGKEATDPSGETPTTATVTTTLGKTEGTGVEVTGKANNIINVTLQDLSTKESSNTVVSGTGVKVTGAENGEVTVKINQQNLKVTGTGNLVDIQAGAGTTNVDINQNVELADSGNIVKAGNVSGTLNINLNVEGEKGLNVTEGNTALDLSNVDTANKAFVKNTGNVTIGKKGILVAGHDTNAISLTNQGLIDLKVVDKDNGEKGNSVISTGEKVNVANYGTIKLEISSKDFLDKYNTVVKKEGKKVNDLKDLTIEGVRETLVALGIIASSEENFSSVGYIKFEGGELFTTAKALSGNQTVEGLSSALNQEDSDRAFAIAEGVEVTLNSAGENEKLENVQFSLDGTMNISGTEEVKIENAGVERQVYITENGKLAVADGATLNYSGNISAEDNGDAADGKAAIVNTGTLTLANGALNMVAPESKTALLSEPANRVGIELTGAGTTELDNYTVNADIEGELSGGSALQGTLSAKGKSRITGNVTDIKDIKVTDNGMLTFGANSKIIVSDAATSGEKTKIDLTAGKMGVEIGESGNVLMNSVGKIKFTGTYGADKSDESNKGKVVLLTNALTENTTFNLGTHDGLTDGDIIANENIYYNITQGNGGIWNATFNKDALLQTTGTKYLELGNIFANTQPIHDLLSADIDLRVAQLDDLYSNNIYSETVKMSLDTLKMNEDAVLSLNVRPKQGEYTAQGKFLFTNTDYDRDGVVRDYKVETKNTGLLGAMEYGLTDTSSVGFAFSGTKQDLDMKNGASADGDAFYFGLYRNDKFNNIDLTTGLGYMIDRVDAKNFIGKDKFDSTALSGYVQGKYNYAIGENLTLSPKARLTVTRFQQDSINNGRMKQEEVKDTMADVELGVEIKKGIALETGRMNLLAGASFTTNVAGKDDDYYKVSFISRAGNEGDSTKVKGANLEKNSLKLNIGADVELTNGVFYNGGLSYEFDDEDRDSIGVTLGAGYKF